MRPVARSVVPLVAGALLLAPAADASFPGRNGIFAVALNCQPEGNDSHVELYDRRGRALRSVTPCGSQTWSPDFSPDGSRLIYTDGPATNDSPLFFGVVGANGTGARLLPYGARLRDIDGPSFAPDGQRFVYVNVIDGVTDEIRVATVDGDESRLLRSGRREFVEGPAWSPRRDEIAVHASRSGGRRVLQVVDARRGRVRTSIGIPSNGIDPDWSPDGRWITYAANARVYVVRRDGSRRHAIIPAMATSRTFSPAWAPDGRSIAWIRVNYGPRDEAQFSLWRARVDGSNARQVARLGHMSYDDEEEDYVAPDLAWQPLPQR